MGFEEHLGHHMIHSTFEFINVPIFQLEEEAALMHFYGLRDKGFGKRLISFKGHFKMEKKETKQHRV